MKKIKQPLEGINVFDLQSIKFSVNTIQRIRNLQLFSKFEWNFFWLPRGHFSWEAVCDISYVKLIWKRSRRCGRMCLWWKHHCRARAESFARVLCVVSVFDTRKSICQQKIPFYVRTVLPSDINHFVRGIGSQSLAPILKVSLLLHSRNVCFLITTKTMLL